MAALKPIRITVDVPAELAPLLKVRMEEEKYPSKSKYFVGLLIFDVYARKQHKLTGTLMREPDWVRDQVIAELVRDFDNAEAKPGGWFDHRIEELLIFYRGKAQE